MRYIDFYVQSVLIAIALILGIFYWIYPHIIGFIAIDQFLIGAWQFFGAIITLILQKPEADIKRKYVSISAIYLISLCAIVEVFSNHHFSWAGIAIGNYFIAPAWVLALYYYSITWRNVFPSTKQSSFLPHISF